MPVDIDAVRGAHPLAAVLRRCGIDIPDAGTGVRDEWRLHCPLPSHPPSRSPSMAVHVSGRMANRWHCFACETGGDCIQFVKAYAQVGFLDAVTLIESGAPVPRGNDPHLHLRPATVAPDGALTWRATPGSDREPPDRQRTPADRLHEAVAEAWRYYSLPKLAATARRCLARRGIDVSALETREGRVLAGHTPSLRPDPSRPAGPNTAIGLVTHLRRSGFDDDGLVDAGLASRKPDGTVRDFFSHRLILPVRDAGGRVVGFLGRDVSGAAKRPKYLNSPHTAIYDKAQLLYRATRRDGESAHNLVVVEGAIDALAIDALAARHGVTLTAVSPSGTALTPAQQAAVFAQTRRPPVLCADGDPAGVAATTSWLTATTLAGREVVAVTLPDGHDPASWLDSRGVDGLAAFVRKGCLDAAPDEVRPIHAGRFLAEASARECQPLHRLRAVLADAGARLGDDAARRRFAEHAGRGLAHAGLGPDGWLGRTVAADIDAARQANRPLAGVPATEVGSRSVAL